MLYMPEEYLNKIRIFADGKPIPFTTPTFRWVEKRWRWQPKWTLRFWYHEYYSTGVKLEHVPKAGQIIVANYEVDFD